MSEELFEGFEQEPIKENDLQSLSNLSQKLDWLRGDINKNHLDFILSQLEGQTFFNNLSIETLEELVKIYKEKERVISQEKIPAILDNCSLSSIELKNGKKIQVSDELHVNVTKEKTFSLYNEMIQLFIQDGVTKDQAKQDVDSLFKSKVILDYNENNVEFLLDNDIPYDRELSIHHATLKKYIRLRKESGKQLPTNANVYPYRETEVK